MNVHKELDAYLDRTGASQASVARAIGMSSGQLSAWRKGTYKGDAASTTRRIHQFLERQNEKASLGVSDLFVKTKNAERVLSLCKSAHIDHTLNILTSDSGMGKTISLKEYAVHNDGTIYTECDPTYSPKRLFSIIRQELGRPGRGLLEDVYADCVDALAGSDRLIIVDQAELLSTKALELLRCLHDKTKCGIVLAGMPRLIENIRGLRSEFAQMYTRISRHMRLKPLQDADVSAIVHAYLPEVNGKITKAYEEHSRHNGRSLGNLVRQSILVARRNKVEVSVDVIHACADVMEV